MPCVRISTSCLTGRKPYTQDCYPPVIMHGNSTTQGHHQCRLVLSFDSGNIQPSNNNSRNLVIFNFVIKKKNWALPKSFSVYVIIMYMYFEGAE